jgi:hypothetical protein
MRKITIAFALSALFFELRMSADSQRPAKMPRIGYLTAASLAAITHRTEAFLQGLHELGYVEGKHIVVEWRSPEGIPNRMPSLAAELMHLRVDVIVTGGGGATRPAKEASSRIPIVNGAGSRPSESCQADRIERTTQRVGAGGQAEPVGVRREAVGKGRNFGLTGTTMDRGFMDAFAIRSKSAFRNPISAIRLGALLVVLYASPMAATRITRKFDRKFDH